MNTIVINGVSITGGYNITVKGNKVFVDGKDVTPNAKEIRIEITGSVNRLEVDACNSISVTGNAGSVSTQSGSVAVGGNVTDFVQTMSGDVDCYGTVSGGISSMSGDIRHRR